MTNDVNSFVWILNCDWRTPEDFFLPSNTKVVTIKARTNGSLAGGIRASFSNNVVTDKTWICAEDGEKGEPKNATTVNEIENMTGSDFSGDAAKAQWIWAENPSATSVWCVKTFSKSRGTSWYKIL